MDSAAKVIHFNESSGEMLGTQVHFDAPERKNAATKKVQLPWRKWFKGIDASLGDTSAEKATAVAAIQSLHHKYDVTLQPVDVWQDSRVPTYVTTTRKVATAEIMLPPCNPRSSKVYDKSEHPYRVSIQLELRSGKDIIEEYEKRRRSL